MVLAVCVKGNTGNVYAKMSQDLQFKRDVKRLAYLLDIKGGFYVVKYSRDGLTPRINLQTRKQNLFNFALNTIKMIQAISEESGTTLSFNTRVETSSKTFNYKNPEYRLDIRGKKNCLIIIKYIEKYTYFQADKLQELKDISLNDRRYKEDRK